MIPDELRKLAETAGLKLSSVGELLQSGSRYYHGSIKNRQIIPTYEWQPHLRIEQAMMVAEAFTAFYVGKDIGQYFCRLAVPDSRGIKYLPKMHSTNIPLAICNAALAAAKEV